MWITTNCGKFLKRWKYQTTWPASWEICMQVKKQQLEPDMEQQERKVKPLSHVQLFVTPWSVAYQAPPSMGFSRQWYWSGSPFPSPGDLPNPGLPRCRQILYHLSRQRRPSESESNSVIPTLLRPMDYTVHGVLQARILEWLAIPFSRGFSQPRSPALQTDSSPSEPPGKPVGIHTAASPCVVL